MPLTLTCFCPGDANIKACNLVELRFIADTTSAIPLSNVFLYQASGGGGIIFTCGAGGCHIDTAMTPLADWVSNWGTMYVEMHAEATHGDDLRMVSSWKVQQKWECIDPIDGTTQTVYKNSLPTATDTQTCTDGGVTQWVGSAGGGSGSIYIHHAGPLGCTALTLDLGGFMPEPDPPVEQSSSSDGTVCLCGTGGTAPYIYTIVSGTLPSGQTLDPATGCISGTPDGIDPGSLVTFRVTDATGATADVTCNGFQACPKSTVVGNSFY